MNLKVRYSVVGEQFEFSGYTHSFYSPHFSVNFNDDKDLSILTFKIYTHLISFNFVQLSIKSPLNYTPLLLGGKTIFDELNNYIVLKNNNSFLLFTSINESEGITHFSFKDGYITIRKDFNDKTFTKGKVNILTIKHLKGSLKDIASSVREFEKNKLSRLSAWRNVSIENRKIDFNAYSSLLSDVLHSNMKLTYVYLNDYLYYDDLQSERYLSFLPKISDKALIPALTISPFVVHRNSDFYEKLKYHTISLKNRNLLYANDLSLLDPSDKNIENFFISQIEKYLSLGISLFRFTDLNFLLSEVSLIAPTVSLINKAITTVKKSNPNAKIVLDISDYFSTIQTEYFLETKPFYEIHGSIFKTFKFYYEDIIKAIFSSFLLPKNSLLVFPSVGFGLRCPEEYKYFISLVNYLFSDFLIFSMNIKNYSREEIAISKKMLYTAPVINSIFYKDGVLKVMFFTDEEYIAYINFSGLHTEIDSISIKPFSTKILDKDLKEKRWPFMGW